MRAKLSFLLTRVVVPAWVLAGAFFKLAERTPKLLPQNIWQTANGLGIDLYWLLAVLIAAELLAVGVMLFLPRLARPMAIFMLVAFCLILVGEIAAGHTECGCLGAFSPSPWLMLGIDGGLLAAILALGRRRAASEPLLPARRTALAAAWIVAGAVLSAALILPERQASQTAASGPVEGQATPKPGKPAKRPGYFVTDADKWRGKRFSELEIAALMDEWPSDVGLGPRYVIFYSRSCDHCQALFDGYFLEPAPVATTIVAVPETKAGFTPETWMPMQCSGCEELELPAGIDWIMSTPIVAALEEGKVICAKEGEDPEAPQCLVWH